MFILIVYGIIFRKKDKLSVDEMKRKKILKILVNKVKIQQEEKDYDNDYRNYKI